MCSADGQSAYEALLELYDIPAVGLDRRTHSTERHICARRDEHTAIMSRGETENWQTLCLPSQGGVLYTTAPDDRSIGVPVVVARAVDTSWPVVDTFLPLFDS